MGAARAMALPDDELLVEGYPISDEAREAIHSAKARDLAFGARLVFQKRGYPPAEVNAIGDVFLHALHRGAMEPRLIAMELRDRGVRDADEIADALSATLRKAP